MKSLTFKNLVILCLLLFYGCNNAPTSLPATGSLAVKARFLNIPSEHQLSEPGHTNSKIRKSFVQINRMNILIQEADGDTVEQSDLTQQPDGTFTGEIDVIAGRNRSVQLSAFFNSDTIARGDTIGVNIFPGQTTDIQIDLAFTSGFERNLMILSGAGQSAYVNSLLNQSIVVQVTDAAGTGVPGVEVFFEVAEGAGFLNDSVAVTNFSGVASTNLRTGATDGTLQIRISARDRTGDPLIGSGTVVSVDVTRAPPVIDLFYPPLAMEGESVSMVGSNLVNVESVQFGGVPTQFHFSDTILVAIVPSGALTGFITVETTFGAAVSPDEFFVVKMAKISMTGLPTGIVSNRDGTLVYVGDLINQRIDIISTASQSVTDSIVLRDSTLSSQLSFPGELTIGQTAGVGERLFAATVAGGVGFFEIITARNFNAGFYLIEPGVMVHDVAVTPDVSKIYLSTNAVIYSLDLLDNSAFPASIPNSDNSFGLLVRHAGDRLYATYQQTNLVLVYDTLLDGQLDVLRVPEGPVQIALTHDDSFLYVSNSGSNSVSVFDATTGSPNIVKTVNVGVSPHGLAVTPDNRFVFIANKGQNTVSVLDVSGQRIVSTLPCDNNPVNVEVLPDGSAVYVTSQKDRSIVIYHLR